MVFPLSSDTSATLPIIVVADAHLGLLRKYPKLNFRGLLNNETQSDSVRLSNFFDWTNRLFLPSTDPQKLRRGPWGEDITLYPPHTLVLLGDFVELWDASDSAIELASREVWRTLGEIGDLGIKIVHIIGNHDFAMTDLARTEPPDRRRPGPFFQIGKKSQIEIVEDTYPARAAEQIPNTTIRQDLPTITAGERHYVFLHGHQFDTVFRSIGAWKLLSYFRDGAEAFRLYSWLILALAFLWPTFWFCGGSVILRLWFNWGAFDWTSTILLLILGAGPRLLLAFARPIYNKIKLPKWLAGLLGMLQTTRYNSRKALEGFPAWWESFTEGKHLPKEQIFVVYGHTHLADTFKAGEINEALEEKSVFVRYLWALWKFLRHKKGKRIVEDNVSLINVPAWVVDSSKKHQSVLIDAALYIDEQGAKFIGWHWIENRPFYIPDEIVRLRADGKALDEATLSELRKEGLISKWTTTEELVGIGWPDKMLEKWKTPYVEGSVELSKPRNYADC